MGRHANDMPAGPGPEPAVRRPAETPPEAVLGWGAFATLVSGLLAGGTGDSWTSALPVLGLGGGATALLWVAARGTRRHRRGRRAARGSRTPPERVPGDA